MSRGQGPDPGNSRDQGSAVQRGSQDPRKPLAREMDFSLGMRFPLIMASVGAEEDIGILDPSHCIRGVEETIDACALDSASREAGPWSPVQPAWPGSRDRHRQPWV